MPPSYLPIPELAGQPLSVWVSEAGGRSAIASGVIAEAEKWDGAEGDPLSCEAFLVEGEPVALRMTPQAFAAGQQGASSLFFFLSDSGLALWAHLRRAD